VIETIDTLVPTIQHNQLTECGGQQFSPSYAAVKGKDVNQRRELSSLLRVANE